MTPRGAENLFARMQSSKSGWGQKDFERLLLGYGFISKGGKKHNKYYHPDYPELWISVPRHNELKKWVANDAIKLIDDLLTLESIKKRSIKK